MKSCRAVLDSRFRDPEGRFYLVRNLCRVGETEWALELFRDCVDCGFLPRAMLSHDPWLLPLPALPGAGEILDRMDRAIEAARRSYVEAGGPELLGVE